MRKLFIVLFFSFAYKIGFCQDSKFVPTASEFAKFINYPISYNTGTIDISIPLFEQTSGGINFPLSLNYHTGGFKVNEQSSWVGLGWNLSAIPQISREVNCIPDEDGYLLNPQIAAFDPTRTIYSQGTSYNYWDLLADGIVDEQPDVFNYKLLSGTGSFMLQKTGATTYISTSIPYKPIKINFSGLSITIIDVDGTDYLFDKVEKTTTPSSPVSYITGWRCSRVISSTKKDTILYEYNANSAKSVYNFPEKVEVEDQYMWPLQSPKIFNYNTRIDPTLPNDPFPPHFISNNYGASGIFSRDTFSTQLMFKKTGDLPTQSQTVFSVLETLSLNKIKFRGGEVRFYSVSGSTGEKLDSVKVFDYNGSLVKTIQLYINFLNPDRDGQFFFTADNRMRLDSVAIVSAGSRHSYAMDYNYPHGFFYAWNKYSDAWGYNLVAQGSYLDARISVPFNSMVVEDPYDPYGWGTPPYTIHVGGISNEVYEPTITAFSLKKLRYPTGGWAEFEYSSNKYRNKNNEVKSAGGLRVDKVKFFDGSSSNLSFERVFKYGALEDGIGEIKFEPSSEDYRYDQYISHSPGGNRRVTFVNKSLEDLNYSNGCPVNYTTVTEYQKEWGFEMGKTVYTYSSFPVANVLNGEFRNSAHVPGTDITIRNIDLEGGQLLSTTAYVLHNGRFVWINKEDHQYTKYLKESKIHVGRIFRKTVFMGAKPITLGSGQFTYYPYGQEVGAMLLSNRIEKTRSVTDTNNIHTQNIQYIYDNPDHLQVSRIITTGSDGRTRTNFITYPQDYNSGSIFTYNLVTNNILNLPIEKVLMTESTSGDKIIKGEAHLYSLNNYGLPEKAYKFFNPIPVNQSIFKFSNRNVGQLPIGGVANSFDLDNKYEEVFGNTVFDNRAQVIEQKSGENMYRSYIWCYNQLYIVAKIENAKSSEVAHTSFETYENGGWQIADTSRHRNYRLTGRQSYLLTNTNQIYKDGLFTGKEFLVSYWSRNGSANVNGLQGQAGASKNGWTYWEHKLNNISNVVINGANIIIDQLSLTPLDSDITTYTYQPLIGMTSETNPAGRTSYYEYDSFGRLSLVKDDQGKVLKKICYNYASQPVDCNLN